MNVFVNGALSLLKPNGLQTFIACPLVSDDFTQLDSSPNPIAGKMIDFIQDYYNDYNKMPTHDFVCDQFQLQIPTDMVGDFGWYAKNILRRKLIVSWGADLQGVASIYQTISLDNLHDDDVEEKFLKIQTGVQNVIDIRNELSASGRLRFMKDIVPSVKEAYYRAKQGISGIPTPWVSLNEGIMGLQENEVLYIGARPGLGKTMMLLECLKLYLEMKLKILVVSTEMTEVALTMRLSSMISGVPHLKIRRSEERRVGKECRSRWSLYH